MKKYEEEHYRYENIKDKVYPWIKSDFTDTQALNGKMLSEKETVWAPFVGDLNLMFAIKRGEDAFEVIQQNMLPPDIDGDELYQTACENLVKDVEFVIGNTFYGAYAIIADGTHEASALCFKHIWNVCVDKLKDDLIIVVPCKDTVLFAPASQEKVVKEMIDHGEKSYSYGSDRVTNQMFLFSKEGKELSVYGS